MIKSFYDLSAMQPTWIQASMGIAAVLLTAILFGFFMVTLMSILDAIQQQCRAFKYWLGYRRNQRRLTEGAMILMDKRRTNAAVRAIVEADQRKRLDACAKIGGQR